MHKKPGTPAYYPVTLKSRTRDIDVLLLIRITCPKVSGRLSRKLRLLLSGGLPGMITRDDLEELFAHARARAKWNVDDLCLWGYFFTDHDRDKLSTAASALERMGYRVVGFLEPTPDDDDQDLLFLQVEKEEIHTVESLDARNQELYQFAEEFGLESYDGMDVGPIDDPL